MNISASNPIQMVLGSLLIQEELATKNAQTTFGIIAEDCIEWATQTRDVLDEIARDADLMAQRVDLYASDGVFDAHEREQLLKDATEIAIEAREGVIL